MKTPKTRPPLTPGEAALKALAHRLVELVGNGKSAAEIAGVSPAMITAYTNRANPGERELFMPIHVVHRLEKACGDPIISRWMAAEAEREEAEPAPPIVMEDLARIAKEASEVKLAIVGYVHNATPNTKAAARREIVDAIDLLSDLLRSVDGL